MREDRPKKIPKRLPDPEPRPEAKPDTEAPPLVPDRRAAIAATKAKHLEKEALVLERRVAVKVFEERFNPCIMEFLGYQGGKGAQAPNIAREINALRKEGQIYLEPFCGGGSVLCKVDDRGPRVASDSFAPLIDLLEEIQGGWIPPDFVPRRAYNEARAYLCDLLDTKTYIEATRRSDTLKQGDLPLKYIWALFAGSFGGEWNNAYVEANARGDEPPSTEAYYRLRERLKETPGGIKNIEFFHQDYRNWLPHDAVIYCDPPYANVDGFREGDFDTAPFWQLMDIWRRDKTNTVLVSEIDGACPLPRKVLFTYTAGNRGQRTDALYLLKAGG
jgi:DNA adenine methylase